MSPLFLFIIFVLGLEFGSFANVCIYRWPRNSSILFPRRSHCPWCKKQIAWYDNLPVLSYVYLNGKCRHCRSSISARYPFVELLVPTLWLSVTIPFHSLFWQQPLFFALVLYTLLIIVITTFTDFDWKIIPDEATYSLAVLGLALSAWNPLLSGDSGLYRVGQSVLGGITGGGVLLLIGGFGRLLFKREAMGGGDVKLLAAFGTVIGFYGVGLTFIVGSIVAGVFAGPLLLIGRLKRHSYLPFGPFLDLGAIAALIFLLKNLS